MEQTLIKMDKNNKTALDWAKNSNIENSCDEIVDLLNEYVKHQEECLQAFTDVAKTLQTTTPTTNKEKVIRQVLSQSVCNLKGETIFPLTEIMKKYIGGKRKTRKSKKSKRKNRKTRRK